MKILYISYFAPYDRVDHAGGKVHNFYLKKLHQEADVDVSLLTMCYRRELEKLDLDDYGIKYDLVVLDQTLFQRYLRMFISGFSYVNPWDPYGGVLLNYERYRIKKMISHFACSNEKPDVILLQWTQIIFLTPFIQKLYPNIPIIAIEEDVLFLNFFRRIGLAKNKLSKKIAEYQYHNIKKKELSALKKARLAVVNNPKDGDILRNNQIVDDRLFVSSIYFEPYFDIVWKGYKPQEKKDILFYGAMYREENHMSAIWFIQNVLPRLPKKYRFVIAGARPRKKLLELQSERVDVLGFVESIKPYFETCVCLVAPLLLGAGIKVKILEAMSAGVPVLTNDIGIEGIGAVAGRDYWHCEKDEDYLNAIHWMENNPGETEKIALSGKQYIGSHFDLQGKYQVFMQKLRKLV